MPAPKRSSSGSSRGSSASSRSGRQKSSAKRAPAKSRSTKPKTSARPRSTTRSQARSADSAQTRSSRSVASFVEQLANRVIKPLDLVVLTRERIQETLDEAAERGRVTRTDANELVGELVRRGRQQTDDFLKDVEQLFDRGRDQIGSATRRARRSDPVDRVVRRADRARRTVGVGPSFPILGYDELSAGQVEERLTGLTPAELRKVRDYERRHANRKSVLETIEKALG